MTPHMRLIDVNGLPHELTEHQVRMMITIGWLTFLAAWVMNICFYKTHPSAVDFSFSPERFRDKMFIYIFGNKYSLNACLGCTTCSDCKGEREKTYSNFNCQTRVQVPNPLSQQAPNPDPKVRPSLKNPKTQFFGLG